MLSLYPKIKPFTSYNLDVDNIHSLYIEECGNPNGVPVVFIHGGPGGGCSENNRRFFDPDRYRIILFDQRGAGRSTPHAELQNNTTQDLIDDLEKIREHCKIDKWILFGGSWGSTLALLYSISYPQNVLSMILRGIFLCRKKDLEWFYEGAGANRIFPEEYEEFTSALPKLKSRNKNIINSYYEILTGSDEVSRMAAAKAWSKWEAICSTLNVDSSLESDLAEPSIALSMAKIECHYFKNNMFLEDNYILNNISKIQDIPGVIIHGRYDLICPLDNAYDLYNNWENCELDIIRLAGHSARDLEITSALIHATNNAVT